MPSVDLDGPLLLSQPPLHRHLEAQDGADQQGPLMPLPQLSFQAPGSDPAGGIAAQRRPRPEHEARDALVEGYHLDSLLQSVVVQSGLQ